ncbi:MAG: alpha/beta hydrolase [Candidatus Omnitrophota bacterium]
MKKITVVFFLSVFFMITLMGMTFFYIDLSGHKGYSYDVVDNKDKVLGTVKVDRYVTEDKIIFKSKGAFPCFLNYSKVTERMFLKKKDASFLKFVRETYDEKWQKRLVMITQEKGEADSLFLEHPRFVNLENVKIGYKTIVFSPDDIMLYKALLERYNFWKKGAQFFKVYIPIEEMIPPLIDKITVRFLQDEYIPVMGRRVETESYIISSKILPKAKVFLSKYNHEILALEIKKLGLRFTLTNCIKNPVNRIKAMVRQLTFWSDCVQKIFQPKTSVVEANVANESEEKKKNASGSGIGEIAQEVKTPEEVFFESDGQILAGRLLRPHGGVVCNAVLIVPKDGPMSKAERFFVDSLAEKLSQQGFVVMAYDSQGCGKSQGFFTDLDDKKRTQNIISAVAYLKTCPYVNKLSINIIGHEGGGVIALKAATNLDSVVGCVMLAVPPGLIKSSLFPNALKEHIQVVLNTRGFESFNEEDINNLTETARAHFAKVVQNNENFCFFEGIKIPMKEYREFLLRDSAETILSFNKPLLAVFGRDDKYFNLQVVDGIKEKFAKNECKRKVTVFKRLEDYVENNAYLTNVRGYGFGRTFLNEEVFTCIAKWLKENNRQYDGI